MTTQFTIERCHSAPAILAAARPGLADVEQWISADKLAFFLDRGIYIAFLAYGQPRLIDLPLGVIMGGLEEEGRVWVEALSVHPTYRRLGVATALMAELRAQARAAQARGLMVDLDDDNTAALRFYKSVGFKKVGSVDQYYYDASRAIILFCPLG
ncbi:GNAT family N-acetyltransferase [Nodosilinea sp. PGN35]|uniref:GNAT family N-acetyltransferase n=1 Tax=Nodosilinea sp. PGN35 TaxID=3020489 RepID=UPI0023B34044|nr:GNAT family N-acetyltransferase [Nodosilinea sp. TSF1-S3]MDF0367242.1 GNAT family N-acetyltransferase [Nodosilinea sp. TSF1-S3]